MFYVIILMTKIMFLPDLFLNVYLAKIVDNRNSRFIKRFFFRYL